MQSFVLYAGSRVFGQTAGSNDHPVHSHQMVVRHTAARVFVFQLRAQGLQDVERDRMGMFPVLITFQRGFDIPCLAKFARAEVTPFAGLFVFFMPLVGLPHDGPCGKRCDWQRRSCHAHPLEAGWNQCYSTVTPFKSQAGKGNFSSSLAKLSRTMLAITAFRYHFRFPGTIYHGAISVLVRLRTSS